MDIVGLGSLSSALSQAKTGDAVGITVLRKAMDIEAQGALQLIQAATPASGNNPPHLGQNVDVSA